jgi:hypothetical protein
MSNKLDRTSDELMLNNINPFVVGADAMNLPGAWSDAQSFTYYDDEDLDKEMPPASVEKSMSAICDVARTAGDNTISMCDPKPPNCPMSRPLIPGRRINPGMWNYNGFKTIVAQQKKANDCLYVYMIIFFIFIIIFLMK